MAKANNTQPDLFAGLVSSEELRQQYIQSGWLVSIPLSVIPAHWLYSGDQRLDGGFYANEAVSASIILEDGRYPVKVLHELGVTAYHPTQSQPRSNFKRILTTKENGTPFLSAGEMYDFRPVTNKYLSPAMKKLPELMAPEGSLLMSRSGTVAMPLLVSKRMAKYAASDDALRIFPGELPVGYLYAYLSSWIGKALVGKKQYGSAVKHLEGAHLVTTECPVLPPKEQQKIHLEILKAYALRDEANDLLDQADEILHRELDLPDFDVGLVPYLSVPNDKHANLPELPHPKAFSTKASDLNERFDSSYHVPIAFTAVKVLGRSKFPLQRLTRMVSDIVVAPRFKRIYVPKEYGVPLLQGSHLPQMRPRDMKYISLTQQKNLENWIIRKDWVLVTCSGTIGRIGLVTSRQDQWAASQHILRILPDFSKSHPGYIVAFLMSPYGQHQILAKTYGGVVDEITSDDTGQIWIPDAPLTLQEKIGRLVIKAFEMKDEASDIEETAIKLLENNLEESAKHK
jgi:type I restriction enzyme S subunit